MNSSGPFELQTGRVPVAKGLRWHTNSVTRVLSSSRTTCNAAVVTQMLTPCSTRIYTELRQKLIDGRFRNLEKQTENFRAQISKLGG